MLEPLEGVIYTRLNKMQVPLDKKKSKKRHEVH